MKPKTNRWIIALFVSVVLANLGSNLIMADDASPPWDAPARAARKKNPVPAEDKSMATGKATYIAQCLKCHGETGNGDGPSAKDLNPRPKDLSDPKIVAQTDGALFWKITTGRKPMPSFETLISDDDRWSVVNYMRKLSPPAATQPTH